MFRSLSSLDDKTGHKTAHSGNSAGVYNRTGESTQVVETPGVMHGSGAGIRTPDTRIMIPSDAVGKSSNGNDLQGAAPVVATIFATSSNSSGGLLEALKALPKAERARVLAELLGD